MLKIKKNNLYLDFKAFNFPGGEVGVKLKHDNYKYLWEKSPHQTIIARLQNSNDILELMMVKDALERLDETPINLFMPYIPYARQDRICIKGEAFSLKVFANLINSLNFNKVTVVDPHSLVSEAVFDRLQVISQFDVINKYLDFTNLAKHYTLISPDGGANKKTADIAKYYDHDNYVRCDKRRNLQTGEIVETIIYHDNFNGRSVCIIDDLCEKGGTFIALAKALKQKNAGDIILFTTHGLFSGNLDDLYNSGINTIFTTNSYRTDLVETNKFHILNLEERFSDLI